MRVVKSAVLIVLLLFSSAVAQEFSRASKTPQIMQEGDGKQYIITIKMQININTVKNKNFLFSEK